MWLSIIIPVYNVEKYLHKCLDSIVLENRTILQQVEILIVDDGSSDQSGTIADEYASRFPMITVIHKKNAGVAAARNTALKQVKGDWIYFCDSDDWLVSGALEKIYQRMEIEKTDSDVILLDAFQNKQDCELSWEHFEKEEIFDIKDSLNRLQRAVLYFPAFGKNKNIPLAAPWDKFYRRSFLQEKELCFQESLKVLDDMIFNMEVMGCARKVSYWKEKIYHYRYVDNSITNSYKANRVSQDEAVWNYIFQYISNQPSWQKQENQQSMQDFYQAFYCRIIKSFSICCRLCFFHSSNTKSHKEKVRYAKEVAQTGWYKEAFEKVEFRRAEWKLKIMIIMVRLRFGNGIYLLHCLANGRT